MSLTDPSTPDASAAPAEDSRLLESQAELEIEENPKLSRQEGLAPAQPADADRQASGGSPDAPGNQAEGELPAADESSGTPRTSSADEPELAHEEDVPLDGRDHEGERMIAELGKEPHIRAPQEGQ